MTGSALSQGTTNSTLASGPETIALLAMQHCPTLAGALGASDLARCRG